jgi:hypothetical protein
LISDSLDREPAMNKLPGTLLAVGATGAVDAVHDVANMLLEREPRPIQEALDAVRPMSPAGLETTAPATRTYR